MKGGMKRGNIVGEKSVVEERGWLAGCDPFGNEAECPDLEVVEK